MVDFFQLTAERLYAVAEGWKWCKLDRLNKPADFIEVQGAVPVGVFKQGKRKGCLKWPRQLETIWMRQSDVDRVRTEWERENGKCSSCEGSCEETASAELVDGYLRRTYRPCSRCKGTGLPTT